MYIHISSKFNFSSSSPADFIPFTDCICVKPDIRNSLYRDIRDKSLNVDIWFDGIVEDEDEDVAEFDEVVEEVTCGGGGCCGVL